MNEYKWVLPFAISMIALGYSFLARKTSAQARLSLMPEFHDGWTAHLMGKAVTDNPCKEATDCYKAWDLGWKKRNAHWEEHERAEAKAKTKIK